MALVSARIVTIVFAGSASAQSDRTLTQRIDDVAITAEIKAKLVAKRPANLTSANVDTHRGVVRLHGTVPTADDKAVAERIAGRRTG